MRITRLNLHYFGRFHKKEIIFKPGINLIYGENESGKSTIHTFIRGMFFGIDRMRGRGSYSGEDKYNRYLPWDYPGAFGGQMDIYRDGKTYRLQRSFHANDRSFTLWDVDTGREIFLKDGRIDELIPGLNESTYRNTVSIEQLGGRTDRQLATRLNNYITNLSIAKSNEVDVAKAIGSLKEKRKAIEAEQKDYGMDQLQAEIDEGERRERQLEILTLELQEGLLQERELIRERDEILTSEEFQGEGRTDELPAILEKYRVYKEYKEEERLVDKQRKDLEARLHLWGQEEDQAEYLKRDMKEAGEIYAQMPAVQKSYRDKRMMAERMLKGKNRTNLIISLIPVFIAAILNTVFIREALLRLWLSLATLFAGGILLILLSYRTTRRKKNYDRELRALEQDMENREKRLIALLNRNGVENVQQLSLKHEEALKRAYVVLHGKEQMDELQMRREEIEDRCDVLQDAIMRFMQHYIREDELDENPIQRLKEEIARRESQRILRQKEQEERLDECRSRIQRIRWEIQTLEENETQLLENRRRMEELKERQKKDTLELEAIHLALDTIQTLSAEIHDSFGQKLNQAVSQVFHNITDHRYEQVKVNEQLEVNVEWKGSYYPFDRLSAGTMEQIYFAVRSTAADLLMGEENMPFILDDSLALYDDKRAGTALKSLSQREQVIIFTCHSRERDILEHLGMPYHYIDLSEE